MAVKSQVIYNLFQIININFYNAINYINQEKYGATCLSTIYKAPTDTTSSNTNSSTVITSELIKPHH